MGDFDRVWDVDGMKDEYTGSGEVPKAGFSIGLIEKSGLGAQPSDGKGMSQASEIRVAGDKGGFVF